MKLHRRILVAECADNLAMIGDRRGPVIGSGPVAAVADITGSEIRAMPQVAVFAHADDARHAYPSLPWSDLRAPVAVDRRPVHALH
jgi:hypothetical protein